MESQIQNQKLHRITATAIIIKDGKYLITKRSEKEKAFPGKWTVPGGTLETKDYVHLPKTSDGLWYGLLEDLVRREVSEETGLTIKNIRYLTSISFLRPDGTPTLILSYFCDYDSGEVFLAEEELTDFAWVDLKEAKKYDLIDGIYDELVLVEKALKNK